MTTEEFEAAVPVIRPVMVRYATDRLEDEDYAEDVVQLSLMELFERRAEFEISGKPGKKKASVQTWFIGRLKWRVSDVLKKRKKSPVMVDLDEMYVIGTVGEERAGPVPHQLLEHTDGMIDDVREAVSMLPTEIRRVSQMVYLQRYTQIEAAMALGLSRDQVARKLNLSVGLLRRYLSDYTPAQKPHKRQHSEPVILNWIVVLCRNSLDEFGGAYIGPISKDDCTSPFKKTLLDLYRLSSANSPVAHDLAKQINITARVVD
jgi:RNA polymerase sigma factor (sigma-70 family)